MYRPCEKGLVAGAWSCFKVYYVGRCQLLYKLHVLGEGLCACVCRVGSHVHSGAGV